MTGNFNQGRSVGERETCDTYGGPDECYRLSGDLSRYVGADRLLPTGDNRRAPIRGAGGNGYRRPGSHGLEMIDGTDVILNPTDREVMGNSLETMAANATQFSGQFQRLVQRRGMPGKASYPDSGPHIHAGLQFGLGANYARPGPSGHDPVDTDAPTDYIAHPEGLDRYVGASSVLQDAAEGQGYQQGWTRLHESSQFPTMGTEIENGVIARSELIATSRIPTTKPAAPRSNRMLGRQKKG